MKTFKVTHKQKNNLLALKSYFKHLPKSRINMSNGSIFYEENPYTKCCCVGTHMTVCLNKSLPYNLPENPYSHMYWRDDDNVDKVKEELGISYKKLQKLSKNRYPWGCLSWGRSARKVFAKLSDNATVQSTI